MVVEVCDSSHVDILHILIGYIFDYVTVKRANFFPKKTVLQRAFHRIRKRRRSNDSFIAGARNKKTFDRDSLIKYMDIGISSAKKNIIEFRPSYKNDM